MKLTQLLSRLTSIVILVIMMPVAYFSLREIGKTVGLIPYPVPVAGTGSMYPSLFWSKEEGGPDDASVATLASFKEEPLLYKSFTGISFLGTTYLRTNYQFGDMVAFQNAQTKAILSSENKDPGAGFIKRIIGIPGDTIELNNGFVLRNSKTLLEPYTYVGRSTFGGSTLAECSKLVIPAGKYLVLGDNRKVSSDSRGELGLVDAKDIEFYLPSDKQQVYQPLWRDASQDQELVSVPTLIQEEALALLNQLRQEDGVGKLKLSPRLSSSAKLRSQKILATNDFSVEATRSGYTFERSMQEALYRNPATGEVISSGFYTAEEWVQNLAYFESTKKQLLNSRYQDLGIAVTSQEVNGCPTQVIVGHFGGYFPPNYTQETVASWTKLKHNLTSIIPNWREAKSYSNIDQAKLDRLLSILEQRLAIASEIESTMQKQEWLTQAQENKIKQDDELASLAEQLSSELNN